MRFQIQLIRLYKYNHYMDLYRYYIYNKSIDLNCNLFEYIEETTHEVKT